MSSIMPGSHDLVFRSPGEIIDHLEGKVLGNKRRMIGTEWEMFVVDSAGKAITRDNGQKLFYKMFEFFSRNSIYVTLIPEEAPRGGQPKIVGLSIPKYGAVSIEPGHQIEFSSHECHNSQELTRMNEIAQQAVQEAAEAIGHKVVFQGHVPGYAEASEGVYRSRGIRWNAYYEERFGPDSQKLREAQNGTASIQVTLDTGGKLFHEYFKAMLLLEPLLALNYMNSDRSYVRGDVYSKFIPMQVKPLIAAWKAKNPRQTLEVIVARLMRLDVPFLPDPEKQGIYKAEPLDAELCPPTVEHLMKDGRLSEFNLNNIAGFLYSLPVFKNYDKALIEFRGVDSQNSPKIITEIATRLEKLVYDDRVRREFLETYKYLDQHDIRALHEAAAVKLSDKNNSLKQTIKGKTIEDMIREIMFLSQQEPAIGLVKGSEAQRRNKPASGNDNAMPILAAG